MGEHTQTKNARDAVYQWLAQHPGSRSAEVGEALYSQWKSPSKKASATDLTTRASGWAKRHLSALQKDGKVHQKGRGRWYAGTTSTDTDITLSSLAGRSNFLDGVIGTLETDGQVQLSKPMFEALLRELKGVL